MKGYFVLDKQGTGWKEGMVWRSIKDIADSIRDYDDYRENAEGYEKLTHAQVIELWEFEYHRITPANFMRFGIRPSDLTQEVAI